MSKKLEYEVNEIFDENGEELNIILDKLFKEYVMEYFENNKNSEIGEKQ